MVLVSEQKCCTISNLWFNYSLDKLKFIYKELDFREYSYQSIRVAAEQFRNLQNVVFLVNSRITCEFH